MSSGPTLTVVGAGACGLTVALMAARAGFEVKVVEARSVLGGGATSRTEGWLHAGTYHAARTVSASEALLVARQCQEGGKWFRGFAPESVNLLAPPMIALICDRDLAEEVPQRWKSSGVLHTEISMSVLHQEAPEVVLPGISRAFLVADQAIDVTLLMHRLALECRRMGVKISFDAGVELRSEGDQLGVFCGERRISSDVTVFATGYDTVRLLADVMPEEAARARIWKSHLLWGTTGLRRPIACLDPGEASLMVHSGGLGAVGVNDDDYEVEAVNDGPDPEWLSVASEAAARMLGRGALERLTSASCHKIDWAEAVPPRTRSVRPTLRELAPGQFLCLPGKLTVAPVAAAAAVSMICNAVGSPASALAAGGTDEQGPPGT
mgnify:CR=1 FL=1